MPAYRFPAALLAATLLLAGFGCGKTPEQNKTDAAKTNGENQKTGSPHKTAPTSANDAKTKTRDDGSRADAKRPAPVADGINTQYFTPEHVAALVLHPARVTNSRLVKDALAVVDRELGPGTVEKAYKEIEETTWADPRQVEQLIVLLDVEHVKDPKLLLPRPMRNEKRPVRRKEVPDGIEKDPRFRSKKRAPGDGPAFRPPRGKERSGLRRPAEVRFVSAAAQKTRRPGEPESKQPVPRGKVPPGFEEPAQAPPPIPSGIVRFTAPIDRKRMLERMVIKEVDVDFGVPGKSRPKQIERIVDRPRPKTEGGLSYYLLGESAFAFPDDKTLVVGREAMLKKMLSAKAVQTPLTQLLASISSRHDLVLAVAGEAVERQVQKFAKQISAESVPGPFRELPGHLAKAKALAVTAGITGDPFISVVLRLEDGPSAAAVARTVNEELLPQLKKSWSEQKSNPGLAASVPAEGFQFADELVQGLSVSARGGDVVLQIKRPRSLDNAPQLVEAALKKVKEIAERERPRNNLRQIGLAMHDYHDVYKHFPAADSAGYFTDPLQTKVAHPGLSWRVHILPFLEQKPLYDQFKLDEPWDSPHNKPLIAKMPDVFKTPGVTAPGKTSLHVFVGKGTPFSGKRGPRIVDFRDGTSNTILVVTAGPDKAVEWTRPGGLPFDASKNPYQLLGKLTGDSFLTLFTDGKVVDLSRQIKPDDLKLLIQNADGKRIPDLPGFRPFRREDFEGR